MRQGRARAQTRESTRATRLTHPHTTPPSNKQNSTAQHTEPSPAAQRGQTKTAQAQQRANGPVTVASQVRRPSSNVAPEPLPEVGPVPSSTTDAGAPDSTIDDNNDQEQAAAEQEHDYASVRNTWEARETEAAVDEARRETSSLASCGRTATSSRACRGFSLLDSFHPPKSKKVRRPLYRRTRRPWSDVSHGVPHTYRRFHPFTGTQSRSVLSPLPRPFSYNPYSQEFLKHAGLEQVDAVGGSETLRMM